MEDIAVAISVCLIGIAAVFSFGAGLVRGQDQVAADYKRCISENVSAEKCAKLYVTKEENHDK